MVLLVSLSCFAFLEWRSCAPSSIRTGTPFLFASGAVNKGAGRKKRAGYALENRKWQGKCRIQKLSAKSSYIVSVFFRTRRSFVTGPFFLYVCVYIYIIVNDNFWIFFLIFETKDWGVSPIFFRLLCRFHNIKGWFETKIAWFRGDYILKLYVLLYKHPSMEEINYVTFHSPLEIPFYFYSGIIF